MKIELYLDSLFFINFMTNLGILKLLQHKFSLERVKLRMFCSALFGATTYILLFFIPLANIWWQLLIQGSSVPIMVWIQLPKRKRRYALKMTAWGYAYSFVIAGILRVVLLKWQLFCGREITVAAVLLGMYFCVQGGLWIFRYKRVSKKSSLCKVILESAGAIITITALIDTGNGLREPISQKPVCLIEEELLARITLENPLFLRAIPFRSVGCEQGTLYGVLLPKLTIVCEEAEYVLKNVICAGIDHKLSSQGTYQMILHPGLLTEDSGEKQADTQN